MEEEAGTAGAAAGPVFDIGALAESATPAALVTGPGHRLVRRNRSFGALLGSWEPGQEAATALDAPAWSPLLHTLDRAWQEGRPDRADLSLPAQPGSPSGTVLSAICTPVTSAEGPAVLLLLAPAAPSPAPAADRTPADRAVADRDLVIRRYEALLSAIPQTVWLLSAEGEVSALVGEFGSTGGALWHAGSGEEWMDAVHPKDRQWFEPEWQRTARGEAVVDAVIRVRREAHPVRFRRVKIMAVPVLHDGVVAEWIGTVTDAEEQWRTGMRERLLARVSAMPAAGNAAEAFRATAAAVVPDLVDAFAVFPLREGEWVGGVGLASSPADEEASRVALAPGLPPLPDLGADFRLGPSAQRVIEERREVLVAFPPGEPPAEHISAASAQWLRDARATSLLLMPVVVDGRTVALAAAASCHGNPPPDDVDLYLLKEVLRRTSGPLRRTMELRSVRETSMTLQQSFLAAPPAPVEGAVVEAAYRPADTDAEIGGDWYDATLLPGGVVALSIGDAAGHDLDAATAMGQLNSMLRGFACDGGPSADPARTLGRLDHAAQSLAITPLATVVHALLRPGPDGGWCAHLSNAGHPPPLLIPADGPPRYLRAAETPDPPLGTGPGLRRTAWEARLTAGDTLVLYTDGLVEVPGEDITLGLDRLLDRAAALQARTPPLADLVAGLLLPTRDQRDDTAVIAFRARPRHGDDDRGRTKDR